MNQKNEIIIKSKDNFKELVISADEATSFVNYTLIEKSAREQEDLSDGRLYADGTMYVERFGGLSCNTGDADISVLFRYLSDELNDSDMLHYLHGIEWGESAEEDDVTGISPRRKPLALAMGRKAG